MGAHRSNLTGLWSGEFAYPAHEGPTTPFVARIEERAGHLFGTISEHDLFSGAIIEAELSGTRSGVSVAFTKAYGLDASPDYAQPVDYVGGLSADGLIVKGVWSLLDWDGSFEMRRDEAFTEIEAMQHEESVAVPTPLA